MFNGLRNITYTQILVLAFIAIVGYICGSGAMMLSTAAAHLIMAHHDKKAKQQ